MSHATVPVGSLPKPLARVRTGRHASTDRIHKCGTERSFVRPRLSAAPEQPSPVAPAEETTEVEMAVDVLKDAVHTSKFDPVEICDAFKSFEQKKTKFKDIGEIIGNTPGGKYFQLQFVSGMENTKKDGKRGGYRFPLVAVQHFDNGKITNGVYLGHVASVQFHGTYETKGSALIFTFKELQFKVGPANFTFPVGSGKNAEGRFIFFYADEDIIVARGQSGGTAFWKRLASSDLLKLGVI